MSTIEIDKAIFHWINTDLSSDFFDFLFIWIRHPLFWVPLYLFVVGFLVMNFGRRGYMYIVFLLLVFSSGDLISSRLIKPLVGRQRPCQNIEMQVINRVRCGISQSFTSSHATNHFALATFFALTIGFMFRKMRVAMWIWAAMISFAQVYVGVHYPLDIVGGAILGILIGWFWSYIYKHPLTLAVKI